MSLTVPQYEPLPSGVIPDRLLIEKVLYEAEAPVLFLSRTVQGQLLLGYVAEESSAGIFTVLVPISAKILDSLERGATSVREALTATCGWLHVSNGVKTGTWSIDFENFPSDFLPLAGTPLLPEHEPVLRTRAVGEKIVLGQMPASVVSFVAESTKKAIKTLLDFILSNPSEGRPREEHRALYDLPIQSFAFASFELSFGPPDEGLFPSDQIDQAAQKLRRGLAWASSDTREILEAETDEEREAILRATLFLPPPSAGPIQEMQVCGSWIPTQKVVLTRQSRKRIRKELKHVDSEQIVKYEGRIGEVDVDNLSFILRDVSDGTDRRGLFAEDLVEEMIALLSDAERVAVAGFERQGRLHVTAIAPVRSTNVEV